MAFARDLGQCCICLPLKLGVGLISMIYFSYGCFCVVSLFKSTFGGGDADAMSISLQSGGYNQFFLRLSSIVGIIGIPLSFVGFLGIYDDKPSWMQVFLHFCQFRLFCNVVVFLADLYTLRECEGFAALPVDIRPVNPAMLELSSRHMCFWGRCAYILGFAISTLVDLYFLYKVWSYYSQIMLNPPYPIDFGYEKYDTASRWKFFGVTEPEQIPLFTKDMEEAEAKEDPWKKEHGPDGALSKPTFAPDGMRGPAYIRGTK